MMPPRYRGRFAPSPTGPLHAGSMVAALASWLDARTHHGAWLVRIEDVDTPRCQPVHADRILAQLAACGLTSDEPLLWQSARSSAYAEALAALVAAGHAYPCGCSRRDIEQRNAALGHVLTRGSELVYPGTCRHGLQGRPARAWRFAVPRATGQLDLIPKPIGPQVHTASLDTDPIAELPSEAVALARAAGPAAAAPSPAEDVHWLDRLLGPQHQPVARAVGDFVLRRADGFWSYQLAVVADDAAQGITDVVRGADLADNTARQILLQRALGLPTPHYLHTPLVRGDNGEKLSKQNGASPVDESQPLAVLGAAAAVLGLSAAGSGNLADALGGWVAEWRARFAHRSLR